MSTPNGTKIEPLLSFPHNTFLMLRLEYVQIFQDDLQAKLLRIIEAHIETQRQVIHREKINKQKGETKPIEVPKDIFVPISYKLFMNDLFDLVTSENTIKKALNVLIDYKIVFKKEAPKKKYAAPEYCINTLALQKLLDTLKDPGYQTLIPSILDTLKNSYPQDLIPSWYQLLIPSNEKSSSEEKSRVSKVDTTIRLEEDYSSKIESDDPSLTHSSTPVTQNETRSPIATVTTGNTSFSSEEQRIDGYWQELGLISKSSAQKHWNVLSKHIQSFEQFESLYKHTQAALQGKQDKTVHPGNLVDSLNSWKQKQSPPPDKRKSKPSMHNAVAEHDRMVAEVQARIAAQAGGRK